MSGAAAAGKKRGEAKTDRPNDWSPSALCIRMLSKYNYSFILSEFKDLNEHEQWALPIMSFTVWWFTNQWTHWEPKIHSRYIYIA